MLNSERRGIPWLGFVVFAVVNPAFSHSGPCEPQYVRQEIPAFTLPQIPGERYSDQVPATLDLAEMARLAVNGLTGPNDPDNDYELYFVTNWFHNPPLMLHDFSSVCQAKFMGPLILNRLICGSADHLDIERKLFEFYLKMIGPEGLFHAPLCNRPWRRHGWDFGSSMAANAGRMTQAEAERLAAGDPPYGGGNVLSVNSRLLEWMLLLSLCDTNPLWREIADKMAKAASQGLVVKGDWGYYGGGDPPQGFNAADGWTPQALAQYYRCTGDERAGQTARKHLLFLRDHANYFDAQGRFIGDGAFFGKEKGKYGGHFHAHTNILLAMLEYALTASDEELKHFVKKSYEWARSEESYSSARIGFFPEFVGPTHPNSEGCVIADMVALALMLSKGGVGDYWDDAERWIRNLFYESQLSPEKAERLERFARSQQSGPVPYHGTADRVTQRNIGAFAGWPAPNDWVHHIGVQHCCTGNGARTIYYAWQNVVHERDSMLRINLLLNHAAAGADVYSFIPYQGRLEIKIKKPYKNVLIRMPEWIKSQSEKVKCAKGEKARSVTWRGRYIDTGPAKPGDQIEITFPIHTETVKEKIAGTDYTLEIKGNTVISIAPPGNHCPLFQRDRFRSDQAPRRTVERFISNKRIDW